MSWELVGRLEDCPEGASEHVVAKRIVAIFRQGEQLTALDGICPHQGGPLGQGALSQGTAAADSPCYVTCPWHGWQFDVTTGQHRSSPLQHAAWAVKVEAEQVFVDLPDENV